MSQRIDELLELTDRREATHRIVELYLADPEEREAIRVGWGFDHEWDFPRARLLAKEPDTESVVRNVRTALGYSSIVDFGPDPRDHLVVLCVCWHALESVGVSPAAHFAELAEASTENGAQFFRGFSDRESSEQSLSQFGWQKEVTPDGVVFRPL